jgi:N-methylhydantoinase A
MMRFAIDTGGTFTDLLVEATDGALAVFKASTTPADPIQGVLDSLSLAAEDHGLTRPELLAQGELLIHGTTHAINAILTGNTARTGLLVTKGHPDILVFREGGRSDVFDFSVPYPEPYIPRRLTLEVDERVMADGSVRRALDEASVVAALERLRALEVEAVAVCLLWSIVEPAHERRIGELIETHLPNVPYTLSHRLNPSLREYRRASSAAIDASLKPLMSRYVGSLTERLAAEGFAGRVLMVTSQAGMMDADRAAAAPVQLINSGPSMAPVAGHRYAAADLAAETVIVADTGGTTFDVSVVRGGRIPRTRECWIGRPFRGHMTGLPSVDVRSIGAGGGSIAAVDTHGLLTVGPKSAGAVPGPACYGRGGSLPTVTDAALVLGYLDPAFFLGGSLPLDVAAAETALRTHVARPLGIEPAAAAHAVLELATENMVQAILDITVNQGIDPRGAVLVGGGGAAGLNIGRIGRRLGTPEVVIPEVGAALSAAGALLSDLTAEHRATFYASTERFDAAGVNAVLDRLTSEADTFIAEAGPATLASSIAYFAEARYPDQVWEIEVPLRAGRFDGDADRLALEEDFHAAHQALFAVTDPGSPIEIVSWQAQASCRLREPGLPRLAERTDQARDRGERLVYFGAAGHSRTPILDVALMPVGTLMAGPLIIDSPFTTVVVDPGASCRRTASGSLVIDPFAGD